MLFVKIVHDVDSFYESVESLDSAVQLCERIRLVQPVDTAAVVLHYHLYHLAHRFSQRWVLEKIFENVAAVGYYLLVAAHLAEHSQYAVLVMRADKLRHALKLQICNVILRVTFKHHAALFELCAFFGGGVEKVNYRVFK